ncbi:hypothetical protein JMUB3936_p2002 (plasmid) [Leptotrichia wadei]|uniref:Uncharacterized protein n=1 Tax=Leptotrichia wadei TaxID=157687 RepID=A0A510KWL7_9FUSO|nr:hypothetical protein JMUB3936_p2002 [Leptotrichia wadei]
MNLSSDKIISKIIEREIETQIETNLLEKLFSTIKNRFNLKEQKSSVKAEYYDFWKILKKNIINFE